jgi:hypothetical protein
MKRVFGVASATIEPIRRIQSSLTQRTDYLAIALRALKDTAKFIPPLTRRPKSSFFY